MKGSCHNQYNVVYHVTVSAVVHECCKRIISLQKQREYDIPTPADYNRTKNLLHLRVSIYPLGTLVGQYLGG